MNALGDVELECPLLIMLNSGCYLHSKMQVDVMFF